MDDWFIVSLKAHHNDKWEHWAAFRYHSDAEEYAESYSKVRPMRIEAHKKWRTPYEYEDGKLLPHALKD